MKSLVNLAVGVAVGTIFGGAGMAVAKVAENPVPDWQNVTCQTSSTADTDCYDPSTKTYVHTFRYLKIDGTPVGTVKCGFHVAQLNQKNDYCRRLAD